MPPTLSRSSLESGRPMPLLRIPYSVQPRIVGRIIFHDLVDGAVRRQRRQALDEILSDSDWVELRVSRSISAGSVSRRVPPKNRRRPRSKIAADCDWNGRARFFRPDKTFFIRCAKIPIPVCKRHRGQVYYDGCRLREDCSQGKRDVR